MSTYTRARIHTYTRHARKEHTIAADKGKRRDEMKYGWVNNVITVQALPQDRHISQPTHPFSPPLSNLFTIRYFASSSPPFPPYTLRDTLSSVVCQDTPAIVSIDACATRLYARANLPCADRQLSINGGLMVYSETYSRKRGLLEK